MSRAVADDDQTGVRRVRRSYRVGLLRATCAYCVPFALCHLCEVGEIVEKIAHSLSTILWGAAVLGAVDYGILSWSQNSPSEQLNRRYASWLALSALALSGLASGIQY
jgi:hypothetical protein